MPNLLAKIFWQNNCLPKRSRSDYIHPFTAAVILLLFAIMHFMTAALCHYILIWLGPVQMAWGPISPKIKTAVTDITTATTSGTSKLRQSGKASIAAEFATRSVTNKWCSFSKITRIFSAYNYILLYISLFVRSTIFNFQF